MNKEKIFKREDETRCKLRITLYVDHRVTTWKYSDSICQPRKRTFIDVTDSDSYLYRQLDFEGRGAYNLKRVLEAVSQKEIDSLREEIIQELKNSK